MIYLSAAITWPFKKTGSFNTNFLKIWQVTKNKFLEIESYGGTDDLIGFMFRLAWRTDHEGISIELSLFRQCLSIILYDNRHWNYETGRYETYEDDK